MTDLASTSQGGEAVSYDHGDAALAETNPVDDRFERRGNSFATGPSMDFDSLGLDHAVDAAIEDAQADDAYEDPALDPFGEGDTEEVEHQGKTYRIPKALKPALMMQADYTRKTQELAESRRALDAERQAHAQDSQARDRFLEDHQGDVARHAALSQQLAAFGDVDWKGLQAQDPQRATELWQTYNALHAERAALGEGLEFARQQGEIVEHQARVQAADRCQAVLAREIEGWSPQLGFELGDFGQQVFGFSPEELQQVTDPRMIKVLHLARLGQQAQQQSSRARRIADGQRTAPAHTLKGQSGRFAPGADTHDFAAFERLADERLRSRR